MFLRSIIFPVNEHIQDFILAVSEEAHLHSTVLTSTSWSCNSYVTAHISNKCHVKPTQPHRPKVVLTILSIPMRALTAPCC